MKIQYVFCLIFCLCFNSRLTAKEEKPVTVLMSSGEQKSFRPGFGGKINYNWQAKPMSKNYTVFTHFIDSQGKIAFQYDHQPAVPTSLWSGNITYSKSVYVPKNVAPGKYRIMIGLYDPNAAASGWDRQTINPGQGVVTDTQETNRFQIGVINVDLKAELPFLPQPSLNLKDYQITFSEEFNDLSVSANGIGTRWTAHMPNCPDFGDGKFADPKPGFPFSIEKGILRIEARKEINGWRSGLLSSVNNEGKGFSQQYGYFEMRAKIPTGQGMWPAFWLLSQNSSKNLISPEKTAVYPEIDVMEYYGAMPNVIHTTLHLWGPQKKHITAAADIHIIPGLEDGFHRYGVKVDEDYVTWYYDGIILCQAKTPETAKTPFYLLLDLAVGGGWPTNHAVSPSFMYVDYVRAYSKKIN